ncbi:hypothetical protein [Dermabacter hominis]|uniref:hypothetical protein n=1 Tax=Dermabacter hominis TaxID=36740 RepID=UPI00242F1380|nr:hypothetical protein [Dermabacter hominis]
MDTSKLKNASKKQKIIGCCGCAFLAFVAIPLFGVIGMAVGPDEPESDATTTVAATQAPATKAPEPDKVTTPPEVPKPTKAATTPAPKPTSEKPTAAPTKAAKKSKCESASPEVLETISGGLHGGRVLKEGWIVKSDINDLWYVSAPIPDSSLTGVWIITRPDGTGLTVSANSATAMYSNWPDGTKAPKFEPVSGEGLDIVQRALACQP